MSLDCEGDGAACVECGEFDFLPFSCPYCRGVFCAAHASCHHTPAASASPAAGRADTDDATHAAPFCGPPPEATPSPSPSAESAESNADAPAWPHHRCVVCQSVLRALAPCPECGDSFCAAHRFHSHEKDSAAAPHPRRQVGRAALPATALNAASDAAAAANPVAALCSPYTAQHPLVLAPPGYRSRRMGLLALVVAPTVASVVAAACSGEALRYAVGICSLIVATEMSVGQLRDRLVGFLLDAATASGAASASTVPEARTQYTGGATHALSSVPPIWAEWVAAASATVLRVAPDAPTSGWATPASRQQAPALSLAALPVDHILRHAPIHNAALVLQLTRPTALPTTATPDSEASVRELLTHFLYGSSAVTPARDAPEAAATAVTSRDDRVRALATRLYLQHQQLLRRSAGDSREEEEPVAAGGAALPPVTRASDEGVGVPPGDAPLAPNATAEEEGEASWPFRAAPPLNSFDFFNSKLSPCGAAAIRPASAPRIVVALFVADAVLPVAVRPMCVALGRDWPLPRVVDRLREEVGEQQLAAHREARVALGTFSLFRLDNGVSGGGAAAPASVPGGDLTCLWEGQQQSASSTTLQNADVLLLCPPSSPAATAAVRAELRRLHGLTGKPRAALKADQMKKCVLM